MHEIMSLTLTSVSRQNPSKRKNNKTGCCKYAYGSSVLLCYGYKCMKLCPSHLLQYPGRILPREKITKQDAVNTTSTRGEKSEIPPSGHACFLANQPIQLHAENGSQHSQFYYVQAFSSTWTFCLSFFLLMEQ